MTAPRMAATATDPFLVVILTRSTFPLPPRLSPQEVLEQAEQITPDCVPLHHRQCKGAELFAKAFAADLVLLKWPDGVGVAAFADCIAPADGLAMYFHGRAALEAHAAGLKNI